MNKGLTMGLFSKKKKEVFGPFIIHLLMKEKCEIPEKQLMNDVMAKHLGRIDCFSYSDESAGFAVRKEMLDFNKKKMKLPPNLMIMNGIKIKEAILDDFDIAQTWDCPDAAEIIRDCKYQVIANDFLGIQLEYKTHAEMLVDFIEALVELFPSCKALVFENSKKMISRKSVLDCKLPKEMRFIHYAVNVRFFNIQNTQDMVIDTVGMTTLLLPDLQYHFHNLDPNHVVYHAKNVLSYIYENDNPIKPGDHIDGLQNGEMNEDIQWFVQYEKSLIQPAREVVNINMGEFAAF
ncbi:MAG: DUF4261 domain-containing protein [Treponema sp.]|nr:DUF4261 domain-containing protein [Treponema sp.]